MGPSTSCVVLVVDRLNPGWLGPYGGTWFETPAWNRLAAESVLVEWMIAAGPDLGAAYHGWWHGAPTGEAPRLPSLPEQVVAGGRRTVLLTDDPAVAALPQVAAFSEAQLLQLPQPTVLADELETTRLMAFFQAAADLVAQEREAGLIWLHTQGLGGAWDAPYSLRQQGADPDDPPPPDFVDPPELQLPPDYDPDELLGYLLAYGGQIALLDHGLGLLHQALDQAGLSSDALFAVTSPRGYPLGEHGRVGPCDQPLYAELLHLPCLLRFPGQVHALTRLQTIVQPADLFALLHHPWRHVLGDASASAAAAPTARRILDELESTVVRPQAACAQGPNQRAIRTPAWFLREVEEGSERRQELFVKPDDRWEVNEISSRCREVVETLVAELDRWSSLAAQGQLARLPDLPPLLWDVWR